MHPPTQKYGLLEFTKADEIIAMGYEFGRSMVKKWREDGTLASRFGITSEQRQLVSRRRASHGVSSTSGSRMSLGRGDATPGSSPVTPMDDSTPSAGSGVPPLRRGTTFTASHLADSGVQTPAGTESGPAPITAEPSHEAVGNGSPGGNGSDAANGKGFSHSRRYSL